MTGAILGTPSYMAPEQAEGRNRDVGRPADVHSLGAILYELLTGRPPFKADSPLETLQVIRSREPVAPSRLRPGVPRDLETICLKCLRKDPRHRYPDAQALTEDLGRYLDGEAIAARPVGPLMRLALRSRRNPVVASTVIAAVLAVMLVAGISVWRVVRERDRYRTERDRAEGNLYRALLGEARGQILARETGWYWNALENLRDASRSVSDYDPTAPRELAIQCLGSEYASFRLLASVKAHPGGARALAVSPDGRLVASGGPDGVVRLWNLDTHALVAELGGHEGTVTGLSFFPDSRRLVSAGRDGSLRIWVLDPASASAESEPIALGAGAIGEVQVSPDGTSIAAACHDGTIRLVDPAGLADSVGATRPAILRGHGGPVNCLAFSPSGRWLVSGSDDLSIRFWHVPSTRPAATWLVKSAPITVGFTSDGNTLGWANWEGYELQTRRTAFPYRDLTRYGLHEGAIRKFAFDAKDRLLTASADGTLKYWSFEARPTGLLLAVAGGEPGSGKVLALAVARDCRLVVSGHDDGRIRFWELAESPHRMFSSHKSQCAAFTRGRILATPEALVDLTVGLAAPRSVPLGPREIGALAVRAGSRWFAAGRDDGSIEVWDLDARAPRARLTGHSGPIVALAGSPDGRLLASASAEGPVNIWEWETGRLARALNPGATDWQDLAWRPDGSELAAAGDSGVLVWNFQAGASPEPRRLVDRPQLGQVLAFGKDKVALIGDSGTVEVRDAQSGTLRHALPGRGGDVASLAFAPDGGTLAIARYKSPVRLWDANTGNELFELENAIDAGSVDFSPDGQRLAASTGASVLLWDVAAGKLTAEEMGSRIQSARFLSDGSALIQAVAGGSVTVCPTKEFDRAWQATRAAASGVAVEGRPVVSSSNLVAPGGHTTTVWGIAASPDGKWLASASHDGSVIVWDAETGQRFRTLQGHRSLAWSVAFSADSRLLASSGDDVKVWDVATGREHACCTGHERMVSALGFHPTRPWLFSGSYDGTVRVWDRDSGSAKGVLYRADGAVNGLAIRPDGRWAVASYADGRVRLWDLDRPLSFPAQPDRVLEGREGALWSVGFDPDGRILAAGSERGAIALWDGRTFDRLTTLRGGSGQIRNVSFSRDGGLLAGSAYNAPTIVWDLVGVRKTLREMNLDWRP